MCVCAYSCLCVCVYVVCVCVEGGGGFMYFGSCLWKHTLRFVCVCVCVDINSYGYLVAGCMWVGLLGEGVLTISA